LRDFLQEASIRGIVVELTLFSCSYSDQLWALNPLRSENNLQAIGNVAFQDYISLRDQALAERQIALTRKVVQDTCQFDNLYCETCNEPIGGFSGHATRAEVDAWQETIARTIREELRKRDRSHLVFGYHAASTVPVLELDESFDGTLFDGVNMHPSGGAPVGVDYRVRKFDGQFKVVDVNVEGISMLHTHRVEFASVINRKGVDGLIADLRSRVDVPAETAVN